MPVKICLRKWLALKKKNDDQDQRKYHSPPTVAFEKDTPREANIVTPPPECRAKPVVQIPAKKSTQEGREAKNGHRVHLVQEDHVDSFSPLTFLG